jgi:hypothetical protein
MIPASREPIIGPLGADMDQFGSRPAPSKFSPLSPELLWPATSDAGIFSALGPETLASEEASYNITIAKGETATWLYSSTG